MNVLLITQHFDIKGGSDVIVHQTKKLLEFKGHKVQIFAATSDGNLAIGNMPNGTHFYKPRITNIHKSIYSYEAEQCLDRFLSNNSVDIAHLHIHYGTLTSSILRSLRRFNIKALQHLHEYRTYCPIYTSMRDGVECKSCSVGNYLPCTVHRCNRNSIFRSAFSTLEMYVSDLLGAKKTPVGFVTVSEYQKSLVVEQGLDESLTSTVYNPVYPGFFDASHVKTGERNGIVFVGRVEAYKGIYTVLQIAEAIPDINFTIIGSGSEKENVLNQISKKKLKNVYFEGQLTREEIILRLSSFRAILIPSIWSETFGLTAVEGMAARLVPIVSNVGGLPEVVGLDKRCGIVCEPNNTEQFIKAVRLVSDDNEYASKLANDANQRARTIFSEENYINNLIKIYEKYLLK